MPDQKFELYNLDAEKRVLGGMMVNFDGFLDFVISNVSEEDFSRESHAIIFRNIIEIYESSQEMSFSLISSLLGEKRLLERIGGNSYLMSLFSGFITPLDSKSSVQIICKYGQLRKMQLLGNQIAEKAVSEEIADPEYASRLEDIISNINSILTEKKDYSSCAGVSRLNDIRKKYKSGEIKGFSTGFSKLDQLTGGFIPRMVWIVGAYTNTGKSFFALQLLLNSIKQDKKSILFSLEMSDVINISRMVGNLSDKGAMQVYQGDESEEVHKNLDWISKKNFWIYDDKFTLDDIRNTCLNHKKKDGLDLVIIDYVQNISGESDMYKNMASVANKINMFAQKLDCCIVLISQLSNETARQGKSDKIFTFKGAGELAAAPDIGIILRKEMDSGGKIIDGKIDCSLVKNRHGRLGSFYINFNGISGGMSDWKEPEIIDSIEQNNLPYKD